MRGIDWTDLRQKGWHLLLMLGSAYATGDPRFSWAVPVLTAAAGVSAPPNGRGIGVKAIALGVGLGLGVRWLA